MASREVVVQTDEVLHLARRAGALVGGELHEREFTVEFDLLHQVAQEHERSVEHAEKEGCFARGVVAVDASGDVGHRLVDPGRGNQHLELSVVEFYRFIHIGFRFKRVFVSQKYEFVRNIPRAAGEKTEFRAGALRREAFAAARGSLRVGRRSEHAFAVRSLLDGPMRNRATGRSSFIVIREAETGTRFPSFRSRSPAPAMPAPRAACRQRTLRLWPCGCGRIAHSVAVAPP